VDFGQSCQWFDDIFDTDLECILGDLALERSQEIVLRDVVLVATVKVSEKVHDFLGIKIVRAYFLCKLSESVFVHLTSFRVLIKQCLRINLASSNNLSHFFNLVLCIHSAKVLNKFLQADTSISIHIKPLEQCVDFIILQAHLKFLDLATELRHLYSSVRILINQIKHNFKTNTLRNHKVFNFVLGRVIQLLHAKLLLLLLGIFEISTCTTQICSVLKR